MNEIDPREPPAPASNLSLLWMPALVAIGAIVTVALLVQLFAG
jgi:hypothetical protein